ncbi:hypothetical protein ACKRZS_001457 [Fusarium odoratissimum]
MFAVMFEGGILQWPGASPRQARIITHYLRAPGPNYKMVSCEPLPHEERLEQEFTDALAINAQSTSFNLLELAGLALAHMEAYGDMISLTRIMINFMAQGEWYQRNRCYVQDYVTRRFTSTYPMAMHHDRRGFGHQTGDPLIDGLLGAINGLRFPDLPFPSYPSSLLLRSTLEEIRVHCKAAGSVTEMISNANPIQGQRKSSREKQTSHMHLEYTP